MSGSSVAQPTGVDSVLYEMEKEARRQVTLWTAREDARQLEVCSAKLGKRLASSHLWNPTLCRCGAHCSHLRVLRLILEACGVLK